LNQIISSCTGSNRNPYLKANAMDRRKTVTGTIKIVGCARIDGDDHFSIVLEEEPCRIYTGSRNSRLAVAREGQFVSIVFETFGNDVHIIKGFSIEAKSA
jgi:LEA14-like dessication related protein